ncbi:hypothetical protein AAVH_02259 [Aphelenchoides avenae]|nr:hypothetical protein AAVH_02259 [Aphelenchus avenae]
MSTEATPYLSYTRFPDVQLSHYSCESTTDDANRQPTATSSSSTSTCVPPTDCLVHFNNALDAYHRSAAEVSLLKTQVAQHRKDEAQVFKEVGQKTNVVRKKLTGQFADKAESSELELLEVMRYCPPNVDPTSLRLEPEMQSMTEKCLGQLSKACRELCELTTTLKQAAAQSEVHARRAERLVGRLFRIYEFCNALRSTAIALNDSGAAILECAGADAKPLLRLQHAIDALTELCKQDFVGYLTQQNIPLNELETAINSMQRVKELAKLRVHP